MAPPSRPERGRAHHARDHAGHRVDARASPSHRPNRRRPPRHPSPSWCRASRSPPIIEVFLAQLQNDPTVIGPSGIDVQHELERVLREKSRRKQADRAERVDRPSRRMGRRRHGRTPPSPSHLVGLLAPIRRRRPRRRRRWPGRLTIPNPANCLLQMTRAASLKQTERGVQRRSMSRPRRSIAPGSPVSTTLRIIVPTPDSR